MDTMLVIDSPIHSVFMTPNTPGSKIPSHGTSKYGEMYAIDFVVINESALSKKPYKSSFVSYVLKGVASTIFRTIIGKPSSSSRLCLDYLVADLSFE